MSLSILKRPVFVGTLLFLLGIVGVSVYSFLDKDSILNSLVEGIPRAIGLSADSSAREVLNSMQKYEKRGRYDDAIKAGILWTERYPNDGFNDWLFRRIAWLYLEKAKRDPGHLDDYVHEAIIYRDKALPLALDVRYGWASMGTLRDLALISESAGDLSMSQRCVQYKNAITLLERLVVLLKEKQIQAAHPSISNEDRFTPGDVKSFLDRTDTTISRVRDKQRKAGCQQPVGS